ncbi:hypothetical protein CERZMDRAFT_94337 [Cercospora zeae-maydis SCOH1-5]|uniref:Uncharacterized protein n=1 Tax=Cercospora zeae-maydis SCOH1-5 TaxID=717836 RepID=A0A6A6FRB0_9PEZI|nr:hypothetical protein CERZMDRAFT_94337 [Cercospora zeae-maydis SCOH1-5]
MSDPSASERSDSPSSNTSAPHTRHGCDCRILQPSRHAISQIVEAGGVPILGISTGDTDKLHLYEKTYDGKTAYVAFVPTDQHTVCSPDYNTITTCQLMALAMTLGKIYVHEIRAELCFWLAGLCVPAGQSTSGANVAEIQRNAYRVLRIG